MAKGKMKMNNIDKLSKIYEGIITSIGENLDREGLLKTPQRAAKAMQYITSGYNKNVSEIVNNAIFETKSEQMVVVKDIEFYSLCEHHLLPFFGKCNVAYIPNGKVIGLSKIPRIVDVFARRLQIQEKLTEEIAQCIYEVTGAKGVAVSMNAKHLCVMMRGIKKNCDTFTRHCIGDIDYADVHHCITE